MPTCKFLSSRVSVSSAATPLARARHAFAIGGRTLLAGLVLSGAIGGSTAYGQSSESGSVFVTEQADLKVTLVDDSSDFTEGPAADSKGNVYYTDQPNDRILKVDLEGRVTEFLKPAGRSNGMFFTKDDKLIACADDKNEMWEISLDGTHRVLFSDFEGKKLNGPNDVWVDHDGSLFFTDPYYQRSWWTHKERPQKTQSVYRVDRDGNNIVQVDDGLVQPNGIVGDPVKRILYVADIGDRKTYRYTISNDRSLVDRQLFCEQGSDGMTIDTDGNVYLTNQDGVTVYNPQGEKLQVIPVPERWTANVCFGGSDKKTLFITAMDSLYTIRMKTQGL